MASFTDQIPQFSPYISRAPIMEAMATVGMYKQAKYDEGVQKIQSYVDNVAGLDVYNPISKKYLESKVNELSGRLRTVAAGDFSNQQLVNSIGGMAGEIIKDPNIQNAVYSAANVKNQTRAMEAAKAKGEWGIENEDLFNEQLSKYYNSTDLKDRFTTQYVPYIDMYDKFADFAEKFGYDKKTTQELWNQREDGSYILDKNGNRTWNNIMLTKTVKAKDAEKMLNAFQASLSPREYQQLAITGRFVNKNKTQEQLAKEITDNYSTQKEFAEGNLEKIKLALYDEESKNKKDIDKIKGLAQQYQYFGDALTKIEKATKSQMEDLAKNPEATKVSLYTNKWLHDVSKGLADAAGVELDYKYDVNPMFTVTMEINKFQHTVNNDRIQNQLSADRNAIARENAADDKAYKRAELYYKYGVGTPPEGMRPKVLDKPIDYSTATASEIRSRVMEDFDNDVTRLNNTNYDLTVDWFKSINPMTAAEKADDVNGQTMYENRIKNAIAVYAKANKESIDPMSGDVNQFTQRFAQKFAAKKLQDYRTGKGVPKQFIDVLNEQDDLTKTILNKKGQLERAESEAIALAKADGYDFATNKNLLNVAKTVTVKLPNGGTTTLTKQDAIDLANLYPQMFNTFGPLTVDNFQKSASEQSRKRLALKYGNNVNSIINAVWVKNNEGSTVAIPSIQKLGEYMHDINYSKSTEYLSKIYKEKGLVKSGYSIPVQRGKENKDDVNSRISATLNNFKDIIPNIEELQSAILKDKSAVNFDVYPSGKGLPNKYSLNITDESGKTHEVPVNENAYEYLIGTPFRDSGVPKVLEQINSYGTSNLTGGNDPSSAWFKTSDFTSFNMNGIRGITGDLIPNKGSNKDKLWFNIYLHHNDGSIEPLQYPKSLSKYNPDGKTLNQSLDYVAAGINATVIEQIRKEK